MPATRVPARGTPVAGTWGTIIRTHTGAGRPRRGSETMHLDPNSPQRMGEQRRYFPDWTHRALARREALEADHNSYLAGGYAEEFGYRAEPDASRGVPLLDGEPPEESPEWLGQADAIHPGYPIRACPVWFGRDWRERARGAAAKHLRVVPLGARALRAAQPQMHGTYIRVTERAYERERRRPGQYAAAVLIRFLAALVAARWALPRRRPPG